MKIIIELDNNVKSDEIKECEFKGNELEELIYDELNKLHLEAVMEQREINICLNTLNVDKLTIHNVRCKEISHKIRLLQSILHKYYDLQINKRL